MWQRCWITIRPTFLQHQTRTTLLSSGLIHSRLLSTEKQPRTPLFRRRFHFRPIRSAPTSPPTPSPTVVSSPPRPPRHTMSSYLQVLGSGSPDSHLAPSLLLFFDQTRYLFGAGEGVQRVCTEYHVRMSKVQQVFVTRIQQEMVGGLTGLLITLADLGLKRVGVHGPGAMRHFLQASRNVSVRSNMAIDVFEVVQGENGQNETSMSTIGSNFIASNSNGLTSTGTTKSSSKHYEDQNISVEVVVLANHTVCLPPLRTDTPWLKNQGSQLPTFPDGPDPAASSSKRSAPECELPDPSIDDTPCSHGHASSSSVTEPSSTQPASKKPKFRHTPANTTAASTTNNNNYPSSQPFQYDPTKLSYASVNQPRELAKQQAEWIESTQPALIAYIVSLGSTPGKFDLAKARALGIPPGPLYAKLKAGESITIKASELHSAGSGNNGKRAQRPPKKPKNDSAAAPSPAVEPAASDEPTLTFHPSDCVGAVTPGPKFLIIDCPNEALIENIVQNEAFKIYQTNGASSSTSAAASATPLSVVVHLTPLSILRHPKYIAWMESFGPATQHLLLHAQTSQLKPVFKSAALNYLKMQSWINPAVFPAKLPTELDTASHNPIDAHSNDIRSTLASFPESLRPRLVGGESLLRFHLLSGRKDIGGWDTTKMEKAIRPEDLLESLKEGSTDEGMIKLEQWKQAMVQGAKEGKGVRQIAEELKANLTSSVPALTEEKKEDVSASSSTTVAMDTSSSATLAPTTPQTSIYETPLLTPASLPDFTPSPNILAQLAQQSDAISPQLLFLGTGSAIPSKYRNVTGLFFHPGYVSEPPQSSIEHPIGGYMFDCGEGTYGQLCLRYAGSNGDALAGQRIVHNLIADLKAVWNSHIHADHHLGLLTILSVYKQTWMQRYKTANPSTTDFTQLQLVSPLTYTGTSSHHVPKLLVVGPRRLYFWLKEYSACAFQVGEEDDFKSTASSSSSANGSHMEDVASTSSTTSPNLRNLFDWIEFVTCSELMDRDHPFTNYFSQSSPILVHQYPSGPQPRNLSVFQTVQVKHCHDAYGLVVETAPLSATLPPYKLVVSGDTQPCQALVDAGVDATLLVHEATLEDDMIEDAKDKRHSTTRQAIEVGLKMNAARIVLTHFSQRYPKLPTYSDHFSSRTCLSFDLMCIRFNQLDWLPSLTQAFSWMFDPEKLMKYEKKEADVVEE